MSFYVLYNNNQSYFEQPFNTIEEATDFAEEQNLTDYQIITAEQLAQLLKQQTQQQQPAKWKPYSHPVYSHPIYKGPGPYRGPGY